MPDRPNGEIFISYSHKDSRWLEKLQIHLTPMIDNGAVILWSDSHIQPGTHWNEQINLALHRATVAVLMVSSDFLASRFIVDKELPLLAAAAETDGLKILWIALTASAYKETPLVAYQALNDPVQPLDSLKGAKRNQEFVRIAESIKTEFLAGRSNPGSLRKEDSPVPTIIGRIRPGHVIAMVLMVAFVISLILRSMAEFSADGAIQEIKLDSDHIRSATLQRPLSVIPPIRLHWNSHDFLNVSIHPVGSDATCEKKRAYSGQLIEADCFLHGTDTDFVLKFNPHPDRSGEILQLYLRTQVQADLKR
jgi:TIR domain